MQIFHEFESHAALVSEFKNNIQKARAYVRGVWEVRPREICEMILVHPVSGEWMPLEVEVVYIAEGESPGVGLEITGWGDQKAALVWEFINIPETNPLSLVSPGSLAAEKVAQGTSSLSSSSADLFQLSSPTPAVSDLRSIQQAVFDESTAPETEASPEVLDEAPETEEAPSSSSRASSGSVPPPKNVQEKIRKLSMAQREGIARSGTLAERVALERAYGGAVWDALLANASLTGPEVARVAKNGNVNAVQLKLIVGNAAWLSKPEVRRALLTNPRLTSQQIERVLRALPPNELRLLPQQTAYTAKVRAAANRLIPK